MSEETYSEPTISCIIPTHNRDKFLAEALESVLAQSVLPSEVIVVDDAGAISTAEVLERIPSEIPLRYIDASFLEHKSAGASRNLGASMARGTHLAFLDDDDLWKPTFLESCLKVIANEGSVLVAGWVSFFKAGTELNGHSLQRGLQASDAYHRNPGLTGSNFVISRRIFDRLNGFDNKLWVSNDRDFFIRFLDCNLPYGVVEERSVLQRVHQNGQLTNRTERRALGLEAFVAKYQDRLSKSDRRLLRREISSVRRISEKNLLSRFCYAALQLQTYRPKELALTVTKKISGLDSGYS